MNKDFSNQMSNLSKELYTFWNEENFYEFHRTLITISFTFFTSKAEIDSQICFDTTNSIFTLLSDEIPLWLEFNKEALPETLAKSIGLAYSALWEIIDKQDDSTDRFWSFTRAYSFYKKIIRNHLEAFLEKSGLDKMFLVLLYFYLKFDERLNLKDLIEIIEEDFTSVPEKLKTRFNEQWVKAIIMVSERTGASTLERYKDIFSKT